MSDYKAEIEKLIEVTLNALDGPMCISVEKEFGEWMGKLDPSPARAILKKAFERHAQILGKDRERKKEGES